MDKQEQQQQESKKFNDTFKVIEMETTNKTLVNHFPEWDLKPPGEVVRRKRSKFS